MKTKDKKAYQITVEVQAIWASFRSRPKFDTLLKKYKDKLNIALKVYRRNLIGWEVVKELLDLVVVQRLELFSGPLNAILRRIRLVVDE